MYQFWPPLVRFWPPCSEWHNSQYNHIKLVKNACFHRLTWMSSKYQDENVETQRLEINNNENGHNWCIYPRWKIRAIQANKYKELCTYNIWLDKIMWAKASEEKGYIRVWYEFLYHIRNVKKKNCKKSLWCKRYRVISFGTVRCGFLLPWNYSILEG